MRTFDTPHEDPATRLRELTRRGELAAIVAAADERERRELHRAAFEIAYPVVFTSLTRTIEAGRGHARCQSGVPRLADECRDGFYTDVEAVIDRMFGLTKPVASLEGWVATNAFGASVDAYRRRRGERGALQRARLSRWLAAALPDGPPVVAAWLRTLALEIIEFVGVEHTAGYSVWPLESWTLRRAAVTGDPADPRVVAAEVETVLAAMRTDPTWYATYIERPLGAKTPPVALGVGDRELALVDAEEQEEIGQLDLAACALDLIAARLGAGDDPGEVVAQALLGTLGELDLVEALVADPAELARITAAVVAIIGG